MAELDQVLLTLRDIDSAVRRADSPEAKDMGLWDEYLDRALGRTRELLDHLVRWRTRGWRPRGYVDLPALDAAIEEACREDEG